MLFYAYISFAVTLIALVTGTFLLGLLHKLEPVCKTSAKVVGWLVVILSATQLLCLSYHTVRYWEDGMFKPKTSMMGGDGRHMQKGMHMMPNGMQKMMGDDRQGPNGPAPMGMGPGQMGGAPNGDGKPMNGGPGENQNQP